MAERRPCTPASWHCQVTELRTALRCPRLFWLARHEGARTLFSAEPGPRTLGNLFHDAVARFADLLAAPHKVLADDLGRAKTRDEAAQVLFGVLYDRCAFPLIDAWSGPAQALSDLGVSLREAAGLFAEALWSARERMPMASALDRLCPIAELPLSTSGSKTPRIVGRLDSLLWHEGNGRFELLEYKLTRRPDEPLDRLQIALYAWMLATAKGVKAAPSLVYFQPEMERIEPAADEMRPWVEEVVPKLLSEMEGWDAWRKGSPPPPSTNDPALCAACPSDTRCAALFGRRRDHDREKESQVEVSRVGRPAPSAARTVPTAAPQVAPEAAIFLGAAGRPAQYGVLGATEEGKVAIDLDGTHTVTLFGTQGWGKSYALGLVLETALDRQEGLNLLRSPLAGVVFHYTENVEQAPEFLSMTQPNGVADEVASLRTTYGGTPRGLADVCVLVPPRKLEARRREMPGVAVEPIAFGPRELDVRAWMFLMGGLGQQMYAQQVRSLLGELGEDLSAARLEGGIEDSGLTPAQKGLARQRLEFAKPYLREEGDLASLVRPGRLLIVDLRDELIDKEKALGLLLVILGAASRRGMSGERFNKLVVLDEAHKYLENKALVGGLVELVREMRHRGTSVLIASQDPESVPRSVIELSTMSLLLRMNSPSWVKHLQRSNQAMAGLTASRLARLDRGEALVWSAQATDARFTRGFVPVRLRPRATHHGGATLRAVE